MSKKNGLANPTRLKPFDSDDKQMLRVVIETPKGSRNKFAFDPEELIFELKKVLPAGMTFPYDFGFIPSTKADDGDPVDVLVLMDEPAFARCVLSCRAIGVIEGEQGDKKDKKRNDRIVAVEKDAPTCCFNISARPESISISLTALVVFGVCSLPFQTPRQTWMTQLSKSKSSTCRPEASPIRIPVPASNAKRTRY